MLIFTIWPLFSRTMCWRFSLPNKRECRQPTLFGFKDGFHDLPGLYRLGQSIGAANWNNHNRALYPLYQKNFLDIIRIFLLDPLDRALLSIPSVLLSACSCTHIGKMVFFRFPENQAGKLPRKFLCTSLQRFRTLTS